MPRLFDQEVLIDAIREGVGRLDAPFGYATMVTQDGSYKGLVFRQLPNNLYFDDDAVIVRPEVADEQLQAISPPPPQPPKPGPDAIQSQPGEPNQPEQATRFHATTALDPQRANKDMALIVDEIIQRLTSLPGTDVEITLEISAHRPEGFDDATVRTVSENSRTLKFRHHGFEEE